VILWSEETARPARIRSWPYAWMLAVATVCFGAFMGQLDASIVTLTYRPLERQFHDSAAAVQWVSLAYLLTLVGTLAPIGRRSDQMGRKLSYLHGFVIFAAGSAACGLAPNLDVLVAARIVQGFGAALLQANSVALVTSVAPRHRLRTVLGVQAGAQALGLALGPTAGGLIVSALGWRWVFAINIPVGAVALIGGILFLPRTTHRAAHGSLDITGSLLLGTVGTGLLLALSAAGGLDLPGAVTACFALAGALAVAAVARHQRRAPDPVLPRGVIAAASVPANLLTAMLTYWTLFGPLVLIPSVLEARGWSSVDAGLLLTSLPAGFALAATVGGGALPRRWDDARRALTGSVLACIALAGSLAAPIEGGAMVAVLGALGLGLGLLAPANNSQIMASIPRELAASAGALLNMTRAMGTGLGIAAVTVALHLGGVRLAFGSLLATAAAAVVTSGVSGRGRSRRNMPDHAARTERDPVAIPNSQ
jgi:MFS family permease